MRLSEAIRLGAMALPAVHGPIFRSGEYGPCAACAIGTPVFAMLGAEARAAVGCGPEGPVEDVKALFAAWWPWTCTDVSDPECPSFSSNIVSIMVNLFETKQWTREQIADWVETIEAQQAEAAVDPASELAKLTTAHARD